jgi:hypothetical protein
VYWRANDKMLWIYGFLPSIAIGVDGSVNKLKSVLVLKLVNIVCVNQILAEAWGEPRMSDRIARKGDRGRRKRGII